MYSLPITSALAMPQVPLTLLPLVALLPTNTNGTTVLLRKTYKTLLQVPIPLPLLTSMAV